MGRWYGTIGYAESKETAPGVHTEVITERKYYGEIRRNNRNLQTANQVNDNVNISNEISIIADPYAFLNFHAIRYVEFMGTKWKISTVDASTYPRLILTVGGVYNGEQA
jgi:hypothetical protein